MGDESILADRLAGRVKQPHAVGDENVWFGRILRSSVDCGRIVNLKLPPPSDAIITVQTSDIPDRNHPDIGGCSLPIFSNEDLRWLGQPILAVAGRDPVAVDDWISRVVLDIRETPEALLENHEFQRTKGDSALRFQNAFQIIEETLVIPLQEGRREHSGVTCLKQNDAFQLHIETVWPTLIRKTAAHILRIPMGAIEIKDYDPEVGARRNNSLWYPVHTSIITALLAQKTEQSVCVLPAENGMGASRAGAEFHLRGAIDERGQLLALDGNIIVNAGTSLPFKDEMINRLILGLFSLYSCQHYHIRVCIQHHSLSPSSFGPAAGFELGFIAGELLALRIADTHLDLPPKRKNHSAQKPDQIIGPGVTQSGECPIPILLEKLFIQSDYGRKTASYDQIRFNRGKLNRRPEHFRGIGYARAWLGNGFITKELNDASLSITLDTHGMLSISPATKANRNMKKIWTAMAEKTLGLASNHVQFKISALGGPAILGKHVSVYTRLLELALNDLSKHRFREALPITINRTHRPSTQNPWVSASLTGKPFEKWSWGVGAVEVTLSSLTSTVESVRIWLQLCGGRILMPDYAAMAVENSAESALRWCYQQPNAALLPQIDIQFFDADGKRPPTDVSTLPWLLIPAAFIKAVRQASGRNISRLPVTPEEIRLGAAYV